MGLIIPAYIPTPLGEIYEYLPSVTEVIITIGIWGFGLLLFTLLAKATLPIQYEFLRSTHKHIDDGKVGKTDRFEQS